MNIIKVFQEAALALQQDPRYLALAEVRRRNDADETLAHLTEEFANTRNALSAELEKEVRDNDLVVELNAKANKLYGELMSYDGIVAYNKAKVEIDQLVAHIDAIITTALEGGDPMTVEPPKPTKPNPCSGDCSACGGCSEA